SQHHSGPQRSRVGNISSYGGTRVINAGDSTAVVKTRINETLAYGGDGAATSWLDAHTKLNVLANQYERDELTDSMAGGLARSRINALLGGPSWSDPLWDLDVNYIDDRQWEPYVGVNNSSFGLTSSHSGAWLPVNGVLTWFPA